MTARVLVHAAGGACHGTPIVDGRCPKCGIAPDTQSLELWPQPAPRRPCAGWECDGRFASLSVGPFAIRAHNIAGDCAWEIVLGDGWIRGEIDPPGGIEAAQLAAEDALLAVADEIRRAVGR